MHKDTRQYIKHIATECDYLLNIGRELTQENLDSDETLKRAVVRSLEIIGEASKKVSQDFKSKWPDVEWKAMAGMRDRLIHDYFGVNYTIVWDVVVNKIPAVSEQMRTILEGEKKP